MLQAAAAGSASAAGSAVGGLFLWLGLASLLSLRTAVWLWGWEATTGKTPGSLVLGLRTANEDGHAAGWGAIFLRGLIIAVGGLVLAVGAVVVVVSNLWDRNHKRQGWHDKVAKTLVLDVAQGRDPLTTGGLYGPAAFAPEGTDAHAGYVGAAPHGRHPSGPPRWRQPRGLPASFPQSRDSVPTPMRHRHLLRPPLSPRPRPTPCRRPRRSPRPRPTPCRRPRRSLVPRTRGAAPSYAMAMAGPAAAGMPAGGAPARAAGADEHPDEEFADYPGPRFRHAGRPLYSDLRRRARRDT